VQGERLGRERKRGEEAEETQLEAQQTSTRRRTREALTQEAHEGGGGWTTAAATAARGGGYSHDTETGEDSGGDDEHSTCVRRLQCACCGACRGSVYRRVAGRNQGEGGMGGGSQLEVMVRPLLGADVGSFDWGSFRRAIRRGSTWKVGGGGWGCDVLPDGGEGGG